jgi:hypothetical protein
MIGTVTGGHRAFDILHVAAAVHLGADEFLTFDSNQRKLPATFSDCTPEDSAAFILQLLNSCNFSET